MPPRLDRINQCLWWGERRVELSSNAFKLLTYLLELPDQLVTKDALLDAIWPDTHVVDAVLSVTVSQLREALSDDARQPRFIETVYGRGYRWIGALAADAALAAPPDGEAAGASIVGRDGPLAELTAALTRAGTGRRQFLLVTGEPGIGKTALIDRFLSSTPAGDARCARGQCVDAYGLAEPYMPLLEALQQLVRASPDAIAVLRAQAPTWLLQLPGLLAQSEHDELQRALASSTAGRMVRELQLALETLAADRTMIIVLEDLHWSDPATIAALAGFAMRREAAKLLLIGTYRPVDAVADLHPIVRLHHELGAKRQCAEIALDGLTVESVADYLAVRFPAHAFPPALAVRLHAQTAGNPLFLLNAVEDLEQRGELECIGGVWRCVAPAPGSVAAVPESTRAMIDTRLTRLAGASLNLLEAASVIGPSFASQTLAAAVGRAAAEVELDCTAMARSGQFLKEIDLADWPDGSRGTQYAFRHALYQQVLHGRVTAARRQQLHRAIAERLERGFADHAGDIAGTLALHYELAGQIEHAVTHHDRAAELARSRFSLDHSVAGYRHALDLLRRLPADAARDAREMSLQSELITCLYAIDGPGAAELEAIAARIDALSRGCDTTPPLFNSLFGLIGFCITRSDLERAEQACERALRRAAQVEWGGLFADVARGLFGFTQHRRGRLQAAISHLEVGAALPLLGASAMMEPSIAFASDLGFSRILIGELRSGLELARDADARADTTGHPPTIIFTTSNLLRIGMLLEDATIVGAVATKMRELGERLVSPRFAAYDLLATGWLRMREARAEGIALFQQGWEIMQAQHHHCYSAYCAEQIAAGLLDLGRLDEARAMLGEGFALLDATQARWCEPELHRLMGDVALATAPPRSRRRQQASDEAERCYRRAIEVARTQGARWWELRAWFSLARMLPRDARDSEIAALQALHAALADGAGVAEIDAIAAFLHP